MLMVIFMPIVKGLMPKGRTWEKEMSTLAIILLGIFCKETFLLLYIYFRYSAGSFHFLGSFSINVTFDN